MSKETFVASPAAVRLGSARWHASARRAAQGALVSRLDRVSEDVDVLATFARIGLSQRGQRRRIEGTMFRSGGPGVRETRIAMTRVTRRSCAVRSTDSGVDYGFG